MKTGPRFWQLMAVVCLILGGYALAELYDAISAKQIALDAERVLLTRQEALLRDNQWGQRLLASQEIREKWLLSLPTEDTPALARAHLLSNVRTVAQDAGLAGVTVGASELEGGETAKAEAAPTGNVGKSAGKRNINALPSGVRMTKMHISGRFEPTAFFKILRSLELGDLFAKIENITVRANQLEIDLRVYWRIKPASLPAAAANPVARVEPAASAVHATSQH